MALHENGRVLTYGADLKSARGAMIMLHGRGAQAEDILSLARLMESEGIFYLAPQAANNTWYPYPFTAPIERNEPWLSSALARAGAMLELLQSAAIPPERTFLLGFSQGACLALEYAARNPRRYAGVFGLSGGLIGPEGLERNDAGSMDGTPVFLGCSDVDPHIAKERVVQSAEFFRKLGAEVTMKLYPGMAHSINEDEIAFVKGLLKFPDPAL
jgi:predicted esterase